MERITTTPNDKNHWLELRSQNINSTESACLFGISPYITEFELYHRKQTKEIARAEESFSQT
jgi:predicted phage-related endonuclease